MTFLTRQFGHGPAGLVVLATLFLVACGTYGRATTPSDSNASAVASEWGLQGNGNETTDPMELVAGSATVTCTYAGATDFAIDIVDASGTAVQQLVSPAGSNCSGLRYDLKQTASYTLQISADGPWEINVTSGDTGGVTEVR